MKLILKNIKQLVSCSNKDGFVPLDRIGSPLSSDNTIVVEDGKIKRIGKDIEESADKTLDCSSFIVTPGFVESHSHLVFSGSRADEFLMRASGVPYKEIAKSGGGIKKSVKQTREVGFEKLFEESNERLKKFLKKGVTSIEIKSGYGLDRDTEIKQLKVIKELKKISPVEIRSTFLGAHEIPEEYKDRREYYIKFLKEEMIPFVAQEKLADFIDVFCEKGVFTKDESVQILEKGIEYGLKARVHADEIEYSGGSSVARMVKAKSVDHFNYPDEKDLFFLKENKTVITLLPATNFFLKLKGRPPIEKMREIGNIVSISTDFNPGSSPCYSLLLAATVGMVNYGLSYDELIYGITINPAYSLDLEKKGSIEENKDADLLLFKRDDYKDLFYFTGDDQPDMVILKGDIVDFGKF
ncbi:MAG: imidazolonepropionase [bacterium]|uniref:Imidazolonepropionase n=2 Tax=Bacteria candidate phyla TaxID=1783234 RepID=A0A101I1C4_UNCT6|nr:MAG: Imidazolonepropionase [candidate division TA06 bacterium 32_111]KUK86913.1 MAG: Imidazolonepropionase [candidate division TA06 bacterium 34_109]MDI6700138.1 imidazolonepropionase [bacterium]HAF07236.1 imidazolonepropionase [candidate division WOR-3 bacterium]HCP16650.1 imidazolonepropionase [candidate division WOR-3 bacterium]